MSTYNGFSLLQYNIYTYVYLINIKNYIYLLYFKYIYALAINTPPITTIAKERLKYLSKQV